MGKNLNITPFKEWKPGNQELFVIAGPCSAETEEQTLASMTAVAATGKVSMLRAGVWKPRTRPGEFEGAGEVALEWLKEVKKQTGLPLTIEVATAKHVELALKAGIDVLWIGARSTVNPFTVQEIADAVAGVDIPVMVKNPVGADLALWLGSIERFNKVGITKLAAIHRGFTPFQKSAFRNEPFWDIYIQLKLAYPELPVICDPSHICGNREMIPYISQKAVDLDMQGLMIESHINPDSAWTDAKQQVSPKALLEIIDGIALRRSETETKEVKMSLEKIRAQIDEVDDALLQKLSDRLGLVKQVAEYKKDNHITVLQAGRFEEMLRKRKSVGKVLQLKEDFVDKFMNFIHKESIDLQEDIMNAGAKKDAN